MSRYSLIAIILWMIIGFSPAIGQQGPIVAIELVAGEENGVSDDDDKVIIGSIGDGIIWRDNFNGRKSYWTDGSSYSTMELFADAGNTFINYAVSIDDLLYFSVVFLDDDFHAIYSIDAFGNMDEIITGYESINYLTEYNGNLYFEGEKSTFDNAITRYNPTTGETDILFDVHFFGVEDMEVFKDRLYILTRLDNGLNLIASDGESSDYEVIYFLHDGSEFTSWQNMTATEEYLYFFTTDTDVSYALYGSDGSTEGTQRLSTEFSQIPFLNYDVTKSYIGYDNKIYFNGRNAENNRENLYVADAAAGTVEEIVITAGEQSRPEYLTIYDNNLYVKCRRGSFFPNQAMYTLSGNTATETIDRSAVGNGFALAGRQMTVHNDLLFFYGYDDSHGSELWSSDATAANTNFIYDLVDGEDGSRIQQLYSAGDNLYFFAETEEAGRELFVYNGDLVSVEDPTFSTWQVSPNLSSSHINLSDLPSTSKTVTIFNSTGMIVLSQNIFSSSISINIESLASGIYFVKVDQDDTVQKFVKL